MAATKEKYICNVVGVADLKCEDVQELTVPLEHMSPNTLNVWLSSGQAKRRALSAQFALFNLCDLPSFE